MRYFFGVTENFVVDAEFHSVMLGVHELSGRHTAEYLSQMLLNTCSEWGIYTENISAVVNDNAANIVKVVEIAFTKKAHSVLCPPFKFGCSV